MGIVRRQSALNLIWSYLGVGLGYVNKIILFAEILTKGQFGLLELLLGNGNDHSRLPLCKSKAFTASPLVKRPAGTTKARSLAIAARLSCCPLCTILDHAKMNWLPSSIAG